MKGPRCFPEYGLVQSARHTSASVDSCHSGIHHQPFTPIAGAAFCVCADNCRSRAAHLPWPGRTTRLTMTHARLGACFDKGDKGSQRGQVYVLPFKDSVIELTRACTEGMSSALRRARPIAVATLV